MNSTSTNTTEILVANFPTGIGATVLLDSIIVLTMAAMFLACCQFLPLFDLERKKALLRQHYTIMSENTGEEELEEEQKKTKINPFRVLLMRLEAIPKIYIRGLFFNQTSKIRDFFKFIWKTTKTLLIPRYRQKDRRKLTKEYGRDLAAYIAFQQLVLLSMVICFVVGSIVMYPLHLTGQAPLVIARRNSTAAGGFDLIRKLFSFEIESTQETPEPIDKFSGFVLTKQDGFILNTSINMVSESPTKLYVHVALAIFFSLMCMFFIIVRFNLNRVVKDFNFEGSDAVTKVVEEAEQLIESVEKATIKDAFMNPVKYWTQKSLSWKTTIQQAISHEVKHTFTIEGDETALVMSPFTVKVEGIPYFFTSQKAFEFYIRSLVSNPEETISKCVLVYNVSRRVRLQKKLELVENQIQDYTYKLKYSQSKGKLRRPKILLYLEHEKYPICRVDALDYYTYLKHRLEQKIDRWNQSYRDILTSNSHSNKHSLLNFRAKIQDMLHQDQEKYAVKCAGFGYIVFRTCKARNEFAKQFKVVGSLNIMQHYEQSVTLQEKEQSLISPLMQANTADNFPQIDSLHQAELDITPSSASSTSTNPTIDTTNFAITVQEPNSPASAMSATSEMTLITYPKQTVVSPPSASSTGPSLNSFSEKKKKPNQLEISLKQNVAAIDKTSTQVVDFFTSLSCAVRTNSTEPQDLNWEILFEFFRWGRFEPILRTIIINTILIILIVFITTPATIISGLDSFTILIGAKPLPKVIESIQFIPDYIKLLVFQYFPTISSFCVSLFISFLTNLVTTYEKFTTKTRQKRVGMVRSYATGLISTLVVPLLSLISITGIVEYLRTDLIVYSFSTVYLPASGAFFINILIHNTFIKSMKDIIRLPDVLRYLWKVKGKILRRTTPMMEIRAAQLSEISLDGEYTGLCVTLCVIMTFSIFSPFVLLIGMIYLFVKYFVDRFAIYFVYGNKLKAKEFEKLLTEQKQAKELEEITVTKEEKPKKPSVSSVTSVFKSNFYVHFQRIVLVTNFVFFSLLLFLFTFFMFLITQSSKSYHFIIQGVTMFIILICVSILWLIYNVLVFIRKRDLIAKSCGNKVLPVASTASIDPLSLAVNMAYEPPYSYILALKEGYQSPSPTEEEKRNKAIKDYMHGVRNVKRKAKKAVKICNPCRIVADFIIDRFCGFFITNLIPK